MGDVCPELEMAGHMHVSLPKGPQGGAGDQGSLLGLCVLVIHPPSVIPSPLSHSIPCCVCLPRAKH